MSRRPLERAVWSALSTRQAAVSVGDDLARRFDPGISPFAATADNSPGALAALAALIGPDQDSVFLLQADPVRVPEGLEIAMSAKGVLMLQNRPPAQKRPEAEIVRLRPSDIPEMVALAGLTKPGPFTPRTSELGPFWGVRLEGRLAAMAGTRLNLDGYTEVSGVCTHPDFRGRQLASLLSLYAADWIRARGDTPMLHAYADNTQAIALYERLGFDILQEVNAAVVRRAV